MHIYHNEYSDKWLVAWWLSLHLIMWVSALKHFCFWLALDSVLIKILNRASLYEILCFHLAIVSLGSITIKSCLNVNEDMGSGAIASIWLLYINSRLLVILKNATRGSFLFQCWHTIALDKTWEILTTEE